MVIYSKTKYVVSFLGYERKAEVRGKALYVGDKVYKLRELQPYETFIASLFWFFFLALDLYFYPFSALINLNLKPLAVWIISAVLSFITFEKQVNFLLGIGVILVAFIKLSFVFYWVGGIIGGYAIFILYLISTRALIREDGVIIMNWEEK